MVAGCLIQKTKFSIWTGWSRAACTTTRYGFLEEVTPTTFCKDNPFACQQGHGGARIRQEQDAILQERQREQGGVGRTAVPAPELHEDRGQAGADGGTQAGGLREDALFF
jgi:hypothetical protein